MSGGLQLELDSTGVATKTGPDHMVFNVINGIKNCDLGTFDLVYADDDSLAARLNFTQFGEEGNFMTGLVDRGRSFTVKGKAVTCQNNLTITFKDTTINTQNLPEVFF